VASTDKSQGRQSHQGGAGLTPPSRTRSKQRTANEAARAEEAQPGQPEKVASARDWLGKQFPLSPPLLAYAFLGLAAFVYWLLSRQQGSSDIATSLEWVTWKVLASSAIAIATASFILGVSAVLKATGEPRVDGQQQAQPAERLAAPLRQGTTGQGKRLGSYTAAALLLVQGHSCSSGSRSRRASSGRPACTSRLKRCSYRLRLASRLSLAGPGMAPTRSPEVICQRV
jgi:hypothetical protein